MRKPLEPEVPIDWNTLPEEQWPVAVQVEFDPVRLFERAAEAAGLGIEVLFLGDNQEVWKIEHNGKTYHVITLKRVEEGQ